MFNSAIPFFSFSTNLLSESYHFYQNVLDLEVSQVNDKFLHVHFHTGNYFIIYHKDTHVPATYTVLNFQIVDIKQHVDELTRRGVAFLQYEAPIKTDDQGISCDDQGSHIAWFKDPGGNIISLIEH